MDVLKRLCTATLVAGYLACPAQVRQGHGIEQGHLLTHVNPVYPAAAKAKGVCGAVRLRFALGVDGVPGHLTVLSGPPELQKESLRTVQQWRYTPYKRDGVPVQVEKVETVNYNLNQPPPQRPCTPPAALKVTPAVLSSMLVRFFPAELTRSERRQVMPGTVRLHVEIDEQGRMVNLGVVSGADELQDAALEAVRHWVYNPYLQNGTPTAIESTVDVAVR